jgi:flagellar L-ring protein precursor FlgH
MLKISAKSSRVAVLAATVLLLASLPAQGKNANQDPEQLRAQYLARIRTQEGQQPDQRTMGSLWVPGGAWTDLASDYKATRVNDNIIIQVVEQTSATSTGDVTSQRSFQTQSGISALAGLNTKNVNPILGAQSATNLTGKGQTDASSQLQTSLSGRVISVLSNNNLVVEAQHQIMMNNQKEIVIVRGVVRPGDITPANTVLSTQLSNLEIELKGKGIISDSTRPPNFLTRAILWLTGF